MKQHTKDISFVESNSDGVHKHSGMGLNTKVSLKLMFFKEKELLHGLKVKSIVANFVITKCMDMVFLLGLMAVNTKGNIKIT